MSNITIYVLAYNEIHRMKFMIDHYRARFPQCNIVVYDNASNDGSPQVARDNGCEVRDYSHLSGGTLNDGLHARMKSSVWKDAPTDWVIIADLDEMLDITAAELAEEEAKGTTIITTEAYTMINMGNDYDLDKMSKESKGIRDGGYDKKICFNKKFIKDINFGVGSHSANPVGEVKFSEKAYIIHHWRDLNEDHLVQKSGATAQRLSADNRRFGWGYQCTRPEAELRADYKRLQGVAITVPLRRDNAEIQKAS